MSDDRGTMSAECDGWRPLMDAAREVLRSREPIAVTPQIAATDRQIDQLVYELYGLSDDELLIVERETRIAVFPAPEKR